jgi:hypothetical protein
MLRFLHVTTAEANNAATQVGAPSGSPNADDEISATDAIASPTRASFPSVESSARSASPHISPLSCFRESQRRHRNVATMEAIEGSRKIRSHNTNGGMC